MRIIKLDGGIGRVICATGAIKMASEFDDIVVISSWPEVFENNPHIHKIYKDGSMPFLFDDVISRGEFIFPEPYHSHHYYNQRHHLSESFNALINSNVSKAKPEIYLTSEEIAFGIEIVEKAKAASGKNLAIAYQPFGSSTTMDTQGVIKDRSFRSINDLFNKRILTECNEAVFLNMSHIPINHPNCWQQAYTPRQYFAVVNSCDFIVTIDSVVSHLGECFDKKGILILGATFKENVGYDRYTTFQKTNYPRSYQSNRIGGHVEKNQLAMEFDRDFENEIIAEIKIIACPIP
jgi:hypothetical protein